jgi:hypothetical protein
VLRSRTERILLGKAPLDYPVITQRNDNLHIVPLTGIGCAKHRPSELHTIISWEDEFDDK